MADGQGSYLDGVRAVTFDAAHTLVDVDWRPVEMAVEAGIAEGVSCDPQISGEIYGRLLQGRRAEYVLLNRDKGRDACIEFWRELTVDWLKQIGEAPGLAGPIYDRVEARLKPGGDVYKVFEDTVPTLTALREQGYQLAVVSNWDFTLFDVMADFGLEGYFEFIVASLVFGFEKPDKEIFDHALSRLGVSAAETLHVGDDPVADVQGARGAGMKAVLIDRAAENPSGHVLTDLRQLVGLP